MVAPVAANALHGRLSGRGRLAACASKSLESVVGSGATVTWRCLGAIFGSADDGCNFPSFASFLPVGFETAVDASFTTWAAVADLHLDSADNGKFGWGSSWINIYNV